MVGERRPPGVQHGGDADPRAQMFRIGGDRDQRLGGGLEQQVVDRGLVLIGDVADRRRQREDHVVIGDGQQLGLALGQPSLRRRALALRAMPIAAAVVGDERRARSLRSARHARRGPPCGSSRSPTSPSIGQGSHGRRWPCATPVRDRGRYPRPPEQDGPWRRGLCERLGVSGLQRDQTIKRAHDVAGWCWWRRAYRARSCRAWRVPAEPGSRGYRCSVRAGGWRSCAAAYAAKCAW